MRREDSARRSLWDAPLTQGVRIVVFAFLLVVLTLWCVVVLATLTDQWLAWVRWGLAVIGVLGALGLACVSLVKR
ncbi:hypothetical protein ADK47_09500 [Streptomyces rimosus subsp. rimosus]|uniref:Integral membrane protein n=1 Tax=Streptomyces rimosus subsp. rimosus TaxID=132474 RepID=A0ABY3YY66_STRRM|nr:hypothetical protein ADK42_09205 [Streptomyces rimosus subsp. rimosus]QDA02954.1 hypothetical protein CTZ40_03435 [Streptomyces rimosus]KOT82624.1 hypothetical protein ADK47_09500 [Streptomyces rimosus subsp. rimosus]UNZ01194.1 hypothetical protein SRIMR7_03480 [Streptomyces rimosus subsp. rimosus]UTH93175.1 hypothetical protein SRIMHP_03475 [Streptomyces rimosus subsp. rimosus]